VSQISASLFGSGAESGSLVVDLPSADATQIDPIIAQGRARDRRIVAVPWETASVNVHDGLAYTRRVSGERFRRTPVERLAHELVHEAILAQLL
jgi:hypothetical protein